MAMLDLQETAGYERYLALLTAFRAGYCDHLDWPAGDMNALQMGRRLWRFNYVARFQRARLADHAQAFAADAARYLAHSDSTIPFRWN
jgi:phage gp46-like protein